MDMILCVGTKNSEVNKLFKKKIEKLFLKYGLNFTFTHYDSKRQTDKDALLGAIDFPFFIRTYNAHGPDESPVISFANTYLDIGYMVSYYLDNIFETMKDKIIIVGPASLKRPLSRLEMKGKVKLVPNTIFPYYQLKKKTINEIQKKNKKKDYSVNIFEYSPVDLDEIIQAEIIHNHIANDGDIVNGNLRAYSGIPLFLEQQKNTHKVGGYTLRQVHYAAALADFFKIPVGSLLFLDEHLSTIETVPLKKKRNVNFINKGRSIVQEERNKAKNTIENHVNKYLLSIQSVVKLYSPSMLKKKE